MDNHANIYLSKLLLYTSSFFNLFIVEQSKGHISNKKIIIIRGLFIAATMVAMTILSVSSFAATNDSDSNKKAK